MCWGALAAGLKPRPCGARHNTFSASSFAAVGLRIRTERVCVKTGYSESRGFAALLSRKHRAFRRGGKPFVYLSFSIFCPGTRWAGNNRNERRSWLCRSPVESLSERRRTFHTYSPKIVG